MFLVKTLVAKQIAIFEKIINTYSVGDKKGVPIGNLTSQYFANYYLSNADHYAQEQLKVKSYLRYMDDILFFDNNKQDLLQKTNKFISFVEEKLKLNFKPVILARTNFGINFLGYKIYPHTVKLNKRSKKRFIDKFIEYENNLKTEFWTEKQYQEHILPLFAFVEYADTLGFRKRIIEKYGQHS